MRFRATCAKIFLQKRVVVQYIVKPLVVATILASSAYAQEASQLSLGQPLLPKANIGEPYIRAENGDWAVRCVVTESGNDPCLREAAPTSSSQLSTVSFVSGAFVVLLRFAPSTNATSLGA